MTIALVIEIIVVLILLFCSAMVSGSEVAFFSLTPAESQKIESKQSKSSSIALELLRNPEELLANILISNNFINIGIVILSSFVTSNLLDFSGSPVLGFIIQVIIITFMILLFGEIVPKIYAERFSVPFSLMMSYPLRMTSKVFKPLIILLTKSTSFVNKRLSGKKQNISMDDLSEALGIATDVYSEEKKMLEGIVNFSTLEASEIMKPRVDIIAVSTDISMQELKEIVLESGYSRIPVYHESINDNVEGILYVKDLLPHVKKTRFKWQTLIRPPFFVPETKKINDLLQEFQATKIHMAIVVDEYGGMKGIVTMEDILEEVVGEITDESDEAEEFYRKLDQHTYIFDAKTLLNDFFKITELDPDSFEKVRGEAETLAGLVLELKGDFPRLNDTIVCKNVRFTITDMDKRRIKQMKIQIDENNENES